MLRKKFIVHFKFHFNRASWILFARSDSPVWEDWDESLVCRVFRAVTLGSTSVNSGKDWAQGEVILERKAKQQPYVSPRGALELKWSIRESFIGPQWWGFCTIFLSQSLNVVKAALCGWSTNEGSWPKIPFPKGNLGDWFPYPSQ